MAIEITIVSAFVFLYLVWVGPRIDKIENRVKELESRTKHLE